MPRGGARAGVPGEQYPNRSDMQSSPRTAGQQSVYGEGVRQAAVKATPGDPAQEQFTGPPPGSLTPLDAPTSRPDEPVTAGLDIGPGPGSDSIMQMPVHNDALFHLRAYAAQFPEYAKNLARLIALAEDEA